MSILQQDPAARCRRVAQGTLGGGGGGGGAQRDGCVPTAGGERIDGRRGVVPRRAAEEEQEGRCSVSINHGYRNNISLPGREATIYFQNSPEALPFCVFVL